MSHACDRIVAAVRRKSIVPEQIAMLDDDMDLSVSIGDWRDAINVELKQIRRRVLIAVSAVGDTPYDQFLTRPMEDLLQLAKEL
jgi:DNA/RNA-binding domain of Phe-tRNA-synthetase-like protein